MVGSVGAQVVQNNDLASRRSVGAATEGMRPADWGAAVPDLTFEARVAYQRAVEEVYWRHRIWAKKDSSPKPTLDQVMPDSALRAKVEDYLGKSRALETYWQRPIRDEQLQAEMERMAKQTKQPVKLRELWEALGNDPYVIAECLARPALANRLIRSMHLSAESTLSPVGSGSAKQAVDTREPALAPAPAARMFTTAVWTGSEMIVWGGAHLFDGVYFGTGGRYDPATDSWTATETINAPSARGLHTAVWTGSEMIVWGGKGPAGELNTGGRYDPATDSWTATEITSAPGARMLHTAVWTDSEMIVWGGFDGNRFVNTGGRYDPESDSWTPTNTTDAPSARQRHTALWTGGEMIVWGGSSNGFTGINSGGRYDAETDSWVATSTTGAPSARYGHTAVWTGSDMIVWGGFEGPLNTGGRYDPATDSWAATSTTNAPTSRWRHTAVWTDSEMIVWGGQYPYTNTGGRYDPATDSWVTTSTTTPFLSGDY